MILHKILGFATALTVLSGTLSAQYLGSSMDPELPLLSKDVLARYEQVLELNAEETEVFKALLKAQQAEYQHRLEELRALAKASSAIVRKLYPESDYSKQPTGSASEALREKRRGIEIRELVLSDQILEFKRRARADLRVILAKENQAKWDELLRDSRRKLTIGRDTSFIAESLDLVSMIDELEIKSPVIDQLLKVYAVELDGPLQRRNKAAEKSLRLHYQRMYSGFYEGRTESMRRSRLLSEAKSEEERAAISRKVYREARERRVEEERPEMHAHQSVRDINLRYVELIRKNLTRAQDLEFTTLYQRIAYPYYPIFMPLPVDRFLADVLADEAITEAQRAAVTRLCDDEYLPRRNELNLTLADAYERWELRWEERILQTLDPAYENRIRRLHERRQALQEHIVRKITHILPEEVLEKHKVPRTIKDEPQLMK